MRRAAAAFTEFARSPRPGEVYNLGGGKGNSCSILEAFTLTAQHTGKLQRYTYTETARFGDHICYYSDLRQIQKHYPNWHITKTLDQTVAEIVTAWRQRQR